MFGLDGLVGGLFSYFGAEEANDANAQQAAHNRQFQSDQAGRQMDFQERMANTAYQRAMADMQSAGLNPMLAAKQGGADSPGGAMGSGSQAAPMQNSLGAAVSSAIQASQVSQQIRQSEQEILTSGAEEDKKRAEAAEIRARTPVHAVTIENLKLQTDVLKQSIDKLIADTDLSKSSAKLNEQQVVNLNAQLPKLKAEIEELKSRVSVQLSQKGLNEAERAKIEQFVKVNLPQMEGRLRDLELQARQAGMLQKKMDEAMQGTGAGVLGSLFRTLNPFTSGAGDVIRSMK